MEKRNQEKITELTELNTKRISYEEQINTYLTGIRNTLNIELIYSVETFAVLKNIGVDINAVKSKLNVELDEINKCINLKENIEKEVSVIIITINEKEQSLIKLEEDEKAYTKEFTENSTKIEEYKKEIPENISDIKTLNILIQDKTRELNDSKERLAKLRLENENLSKKIRRRKLYF